MFNVVVATDLTPVSLEKLRAADDLHITVVTPTLAALKPHLADAHALIVRDDLVIEAALLDSAPLLRLIACVAISLNNVDVDAATQRGIVVMNTPGVTAVAAGEHTLALMLALSRRLVSAHNSLREGYWLLDRSRQVGIQLAGKTIGIVGLGRVGSIVALRCLSFGMSVIAYDPYINDELVTDKRIQLVGMREILSRSDFISLHVPATTQTRGMLDVTAFSQMKTGVRIINTAHGSILDETALAEAIKSGRVAGAALDVYRETPPYNNPLIGMESVIHTPHIGDNTVEAMTDVSIRVVEQVIDALHETDFRNAVNMPIAQGVEYETIRPYMHLAECMGAVLMTLARTPVARVQVQVMGEELAGMIKPITVGILKGLLKPIVGNAVSVVNAPVIARDRGWEVQQVKNLQSGDYTNNVTCQIKLDDGEPITIVGILLDRRQPHIVQINQYRMNFLPEGYMLLMGSYDRPGVIGRVGTLLSERKVNIASWHTGRVEPGGNTLTVLTLDEPAPDDVMTELRGLDFVRHAHQLKI